MARKTNIRCGKLYVGTGSQVLEDQVVVLQDGVVARIAPSAQIAPSADADEIDHSRHFVLPGLIDVHTHLAYGNAKSEEDIDIYTPLELRALRGMFFAHHVLASGYTTIVAPGGSGMVTTAIRDAVDAGLFPGPRITAAGRYITSRQGLTDWYPTWIGVPTTSIGSLVTNKSEAIEEIRRQVKEGVDAVKLALDGFQFRPDGDIVAAFTQDEVKAMVDEIHRLGKIAIAHAHGREASLYAGRAGVDLIFHCSFIDDEGLQAVIDNKCAISPSLTLLKNTMDFCRPGDPAFNPDRQFLYHAEFARATTVLRRAKEAGVRMPTGTDTGFACTPFGEWHARELDIYVQDMGFTPLEALEAATSVGATVLRPGDKVGTLATGYRGDLVAVDGDVSRDVSLLLKRERMVAVYKDGVRVTAPKRDYNPRRITDFNQTLYSDLYTRERVAELALLPSGGAPLSAVA